MNETLQDQNNLDFLSQNTIEGEEKSEISIQTDQGDSESPDCIEQISRSSSSISNPSTAGPSTNLVRGRRRKILYRLW